MTSRSAREVQTLARHARRLARLAFGSFVAVHAQFVCPAETDAQTTSLTLYAGQAHVLDAGDVRRIAVGNGKILQATTLDERQVLLIPEAPGRTSVHLWPRRGRERAYVVTVLASEPGRLLEGVRAVIADDPNLRASVVGDRVVVEGQDATESQFARLAEIAKSFPQVLNLVNKVGVERMIAMDVRMVEIKRSALENIGVRWQGSGTGPVFGVIGDLHRGTAFGPGGVGSSVGIDARARVAPFSSVLALAASFESAINLMVQSGDAVILAEPRLSCRSGGTARFVAGGELPIPQTSGLGAVTVTFKEYGVKFDISPVASSSGVIGARIATEISSVNADVQVKDIPGLLKRRAETDVNLRENETLVIAGLLSHEAAASVDKVPAIGDVPILGRLFRSRGFREQQTDLVVFVTPRFVDGESTDAESLAEEGLQRAERTRRLLQEGY